MMRLRLVAKFIVPDWGDKVNSGIACRDGTTTLCRSQLYPSVRDYEFGYRILVMFALAKEDFNTRLDLIRILL
jgi:hypothetical protein